MDARTNIEGRLDSRQATDSLACAALGPVVDANESPNVALHQSASVNEIAEIFKKTPCAAGLKPGGRYLAKDLYEVGAIPLLMKTLLDHGHADGVCMTVQGQTTAENLKSVKPTAATGGVVGLKDNLAPGGAIVRVSGMLLHGDMIEAEAEAGTLDEKLSDADLDNANERLPRATNCTSGALWKYAQQIGQAVDGAVTHPGAAHEKQCYADI
jgi:dihydroxyacid dehydratase/phosphogluconate dehydratase